MLFYFEIAAVSFTLIVCLFYLKKYIFQNTYSFFYESVTLFAIYVTLIYGVKTSELIKNKYYLYGVIAASFLYYICGIAHTKMKLSFWEQCSFQLIIALIPVALSIKIQFITNPFSGGYYYFYFFSIPITVLWIVSIIQFYSFTQTVKKLSMSFCFVVSVICFLAAYYKNGDFWPLAIASILSGASLAYLLSEHIFSVEEPNSSLIFPIGFLLAVLSILGVSKRIAFVTFLFPIIAFGIPITFVSSIIFLSYVKGISYKSSTPLFPRFRWMLSRKRISIYIYISILYFSSLIIVILFPLHVLMVKIIFIICLSILFACIANKVLIKRVDSIVIPQQKRMNIMNVPIDNCTVEEIVDYMYETVKKRSSAFIITPNTLMIEHAKRNEQLMESLQNSDKNIPDGIGVVWAADFLGMPLYERVPGIDVVKAFLKMKKDQSVSVFLLGSSEHIVEKAAEKMKEIGDNIVIAGYHHGFFSDDAEIIEQINCSSADVLFVALGSPKQEVWILKNREKMCAHVYIGVGGTFDVLAGAVKRAPVIFQRTGLEWLYRTVCEPKRIFRILTIPVFVFNIFREKLFISDD